MGRAMEEHFCDVDDRVEANLREEILRRPVTLAHQESVP
jgi:hypothetical protein